MTADDLDEGDLDVMVEDLADDEDAALEAAIERGLVAGAGRQGLGAMIADAIEKVAGPPTVCTVAPKSFGRVTGWVLVCAVHGTKDVAVQSQDAAVGAAREHLREHHGARGRIVVETKAIGARRGRGPLPRSPGRPARAPAQW